MKLSYGFVVATQLLAVLALPSPNKNNNKSASTTTTSVATATRGEAAASTTAAAAGEGAEEGAAENEVELTGEFGAQINLGGDNVKTDVVFTAGVRTTISGYPSMTVKLTILPAKRRPRSRIPKPGGPRPNRHREHDSRHRTTRIHCPRGRVVRRRSRGWRRRPDSRQD